MGWFRGGKVSAKQFADTKKLRELGFTGVPEVKALIKGEKEAAENFPEEFEKSERLRKLIKKRL